MTTTRTHRAAHRPAGPPSAACTCRRLVLGKLVDGGKPWLIATFRPPRPGRDAELVAVERHHWRKRDGCIVPYETIDPKEWITS